MLEGERHVKRKLRMHMGTHKSSIEEMRGKRERERERERE